jgi:hypothetical protein
VASDPGSPPSKQGPPARPEPEQPAPTRSRAQKAKLGITGLFGWLGIFGVGAAIGAIMGWQDVRGWLIGIVVSAVTVALGFVLRRSLSSV